MAFIVDLKNKKQAVIFMDILIKNNFRGSLIHSSDVGLFLGDNSEYFSIASRKLPVILNCLFGLGYSDSILYRKFFGFPTKHKPMYDSWDHVIIDKNAMEYEKNKVLEKVLTDDRYIQKISNVCQKEGEALLAFSQKIRKKDFSSESDEQISQIVKIFFDLMLREAAFLLLPLSLQNYFENRIKNILKTKIKKYPLREKYFSILASPIKENSSYFEQIDILRLAIRYQKINSFTDLEGAIKKHLFLYDAQGAKYGCGKIWTDNFLKKRIQFLAKDKHIERKLKRIINLPIKRNSEIQKIQEKLKLNREYVLDIQIARELVYLRTYRTDILSHAFVNAFSLLKEIGKRGNLSREDVCECFPDEILSMKFPSEKFIKERAKQIIAKFSEGKIYWEYGKNAKKISESICGKEKLVKKNEGEKTLLAIKGNIGNKGFAVGKVRIIRDNSQLDKVGKGDVLVAIMTTPDYIPAMEKADAFVTDEGGMLCHAAIISRELEKPCVIGTKIATQVLKDGDLVKVDASKGIVKVLKKRYKRDMYRDYNRKFV